jgi:hypothetical protein
MKPRVEPRTRPLIQLIEECDNESFDGINGNNVETFEYIVSGYPLNQVVFWRESKEEQFELLNPNQLMDLISILKRDNIYYDLLNEYIVYETNSLSYRIPLNKMFDTRAAFLLERQLLKEKYNENTITKIQDNWASISTYLVDLPIQTVYITGGNKYDILVNIGRM